MIASYTDMFHLFPADGYDNNRFALRVATSVCALADSTLNGAQARGLWAWPD